MTDPLRHVGPRALRADRAWALRRLARAGSDPGLEAAVRKLDGALEARLAATVERRAAASPHPDLFALSQTAADDAALRAAWRDLVERRLPALADVRAWPVRHDHCFARILLDNAVGAPWRTRIAAPAWRNAPVAVLKSAVALGEAVARGETDLHALNVASLRLRGKTPGDARSARG